MELFFINPLVTLCAAFVASVLIALFSVPSLHQVARARSLYVFQQGDEPRMSLTPNLGGISLFIAFVIPVSIFSYPTIDNALVYLIAALVILLFSGLMEDVLSLLPFKRLIAVTSAVVIFSDMSGLRFTRLLAPSIIPLEYHIGLYLTLTYFLVLHYSFAFLRRRIGMAPAIGLAIGIAGTIAAIFSQLWFIGIISASLTGATLVLVIMENHSRYRVDTGMSGNMQISFLSGIILLYLSKMDLSPITNAHSVGLAWLPFVIMFFVAAMALTEWLIRRGKSYGKVKDTFLGKIHPLVLLFLVAFVEIALIAACMFF